MNQEEMIVKKLVDLENRTEYIDKEVLKLKIEFAEYRMNMKNIYGSITVACICLGLVVSAVLVKLW